MKKMMLRLGCLVLALMLAGCGAPAAGEGGAGAPRHGKMAPDGGYGACQGLELTFFGLHQSYTEMRLWQQDGKNWLHVFGRWGEVELTRQVDRAVFERVQRIFDEQDIYSWRYTDADPTDTFYLGYTLTASFENGTVFSQGNDDNRPGNFNAGFEALAGYLYSYALNLPAYTVAPEDTPKTMLFSFHENTGVWLDYEKRTLTFTGNPAYYLEDIYYGEPRYVDETAQAFGFDELDADMLDEFSRLAVAFFNRRGDALGPNVQPGFYGDEVQAMPRSLLTVEDAGGNMQRVPIYTWYADEQDADYMALETLGYALAGRSLSDETRDRRFGALFNDRKYYCWLTEAGQLVVIDPQRLRVTVDGVEFATTREALTAFHPLSVFEIDKGPGSWGSYVLYAPEIFTNDDNLPPGATLETVTAFAQSGDYLWLFGLGWQYDGGDVLIIGGSGTEAAPIENIRRYMDPLLADLAPAEG